MDRFEDLLGKTLVKIDGAVPHSDRITLHTADETFVLYHSQDCCESVQVAEVVGDVGDLIGTPLLLAEQVEGGQNECPGGVSTPQYPDSFTWAFYKLATAKGHVTIRWLGESNGYYSESVDFAKI